MTINDGSPNSPWRTSLLQKTYGLSHLYDLLPVLFGVLFGLSSVPFGYPWFGFFCFVPLLYYIRLPISSRRQWFWISVGILISIFIQQSFFFSLLLFSAYAYLAIVILFSAVYLTLIFFVLALMGLKRYLNLPIILTAPFIWVLKEQIPRLSPQKFPWHNFGYSLTQSPFLLQFIDITGIYGATFWLILINAILFTLIWNWRKKSICIPVVIILVISIGLPMVYNWSRWDRENTNPGFKVGMIQTNIDQNKKWEPSLRNHHMIQLLKMSQDLLQYEPDLIVWPEAALPYIVDQDNESRFVPPLTDELKNIPILLGAVTGCNPDEHGWCTTLWNSAYLFHGGSKFEKRYDKRFLAPVTEGMPYPFLLNPVKKMLPPIYGKTLPGKDITIFEVQKTRFAVLICFESVFPSISREFAQKGAQFLVNITNDAWFGDTIAAYQHASFLSARAIENRRPIARCAQNGISGFIDRYGRMRNTTKLNTRVVLSSSISPNTEITFFTKYGDLVSIISVITCSCFLCLVLAKKWFGLDLYERWFTRNTR
jgi:apolipoprotein N-acyltransferase